MKDRMVLKVLTVVLALAAGSALGQDDFSDPDGSIALAEHLTTFAHQTFHQEKIPVKALQIDAALYRAALRLNPKEPRYARALSDIMLEMNDVPGAADALSGYMKLDPADQNAQVQYIDVQLASDQMQSLDQRLNYLRYLLSIGQIANPVKSEIAYRGAQLLMNRGQTDEAMKLLQSARVLNPLNVKVLRTLYVMTQEKALPVDRVQQLLAILRANPADPVVASRLAEQLAYLGLVGPSITWYAAANQLYDITRVRADPAFVLGAGSELLIGKRVEDAATLATRYTAALPSDADGWFVALSILKFQLSLYQDPAMEALQKSTIQRASIAIANRILVLRNQTGDTEATTRPVDAATDTVLPDLSDDTGRFKAAHYRDLIGLYQSSLESLAWLNLYYRSDANLAAPLIDDLARIGVAPNDPTYLRLRAWQQYRGGDPQGALPKLQALGKNDPLAAMGAIMIESENPATEPKAKVKAQKLLDDHPCGVIGAVIWSEFTKYHLTVDPSPDSGSALALAENIPQGFLQLISVPREIYTLDIAPLKSSFSFGDPILVRVTLQNIGTDWLAIGNDCALQPELWFNARLRGMMSQTIPGIAVGRLDQRFVLGPGDTVSTIVRVDQDALHRLFSVNPKVDLEVNLELVTNPVFGSDPSSKNGPSMRPGVGGYSQSSTDLISREPTPIDSPQQRLAVYQGLNSDDGGEKIRTMTVLAAYIRALGDQKADQVQAIVTEMLNKLRRVDNAGKDCVLSYQKYLLAQAASDADRPDAIKAMAKDEHWQTRLLALQLAGQEGDKDMDVVNQLMGSKDPIISDYAAALSQSLEAAKNSPPEQAAPPAPDDTTDSTMPPPPAPETSETPGQ